MEDKRIPKLNRRSFMRLSAGMAAMSYALPPQTALASAGEQLATLIDLSLCDGCTDKDMPACVAACRAISKGRIPRIAEPIPMPWPRKTIEDWSKKQDVYDRLTPYNYLYVLKAEIEQNGLKRTLFVPRRCMHCDNPACATICPFSANHKQKNGAVVIDPDLCFGGAKCRSVCPWEIPQRQSGVGIYLHVLPTLAGNGVMYKCDLCNERLKQGKPPGCVESCPRQATLIGTRKDIYSRAEQRAKELNGHIYGKTENGGTSTLYVSAVPFDLINKAIRKQPGRPDMPTGIARSMAGTDIIGKLVLASPIIGIAGGAAGAFRWLSRRRRLVQEEEKSNG